MSESRTPAALRLELLRLVHRHDHTTEQIVGRAAGLEAYVLGAQAPPHPAGKARGRSDRP